MAQQRRSGARDNDDDDYTEGEREEDEVMRGNIEGREARGTSNKIYLGRSSPRHKGRGGGVGEERG